MKKPNLDKLNIKNIDWKKLLTNISKYRVPLAALVILALFGYSLLQVSSISKPSPNQELIEAGRLENLGKRINFDDDTVKLIQERNDRGQDVTPTNLGTSDPFN